MRLKPAGNRVDLVLSAQGLEDHVLERMRLGLLGRDLLRIDKLLNKRLVLCHLIDLAVSHQVRAAVADLDNINGFGSNSDTRECCSHSLKLRIGTPLLVYQVVSVKRRVIEIADQKMIVIFGR